METSVGITGNNNEEGTATIAWEIADYDANIAGTYTATGVLTLPEGWEGNPENVTATVTVKENPEAVLEEAIQNALNYNYTGENLYTYVGEAEYNNFRITRTYAGTLAEHLNDSAISNDIARYLGALHRIDNGESVAKIIYKDTGYTWMANLQGDFLKGSNWRKDLLNTLISVIVDDAGLGMLTDGVTVSLVDNDGNSVDLTFLAKFAE